MKILRWIWWAGLPFFGLMCIVDAIAFAGWGLSLWLYKPDPDAFILTVVFLSAGIGAIERALAERNGKNIQ